MGGPWTDALAASASAALLILLVRLILFVVHVNGTSMVPTFQPGDAVLTLRRHVWPRVRRGEVVVCRLPEGIPGPDAFLVKRVVAVGGDPLPAMTADPPRAAAAGRVPPGQVFVRGDGPRSYDSRQFGPIPLDHVVGHVLARLSVAVPPQQRSRPDDSHQPDRTS
jgi:signal peptidase I